MPSKRRQKKGSQTDKRSNRRPIQKGKIKNGLKPRLQFSFGAGERTSLGLLQERVVIVESPRYGRVRYSVLAGSSISAIGHVLLRLGLLGLGTDFQPVSLVE